MEYPMSDNETSGREILVRQITRYHDCRYWHLIMVRGFSPEAASKRIEREWKVASRGIKIPENKVEYP